MSQRRDTKTVKEEGTFQAWVGPAIPGVAFGNAVAREARFRQGGVERVGKRADI